MEQRFFTSETEWEQWLSHHVDLEAGIQIKFAKKDSGIQSLHYPEALDVALCYGWIDGRSNSLDETYYLQKFTPRRPKSTWSQRNVKKAEELIKAGRMKAPGFAAIEAAKADGRWEAAYASAKNITVPSELLSVFKERPNLKRVFEALSSANRYAVLWRLATARTEKTKQARLAKIIGMLESGETFH
ncbi:MAG TPA: YdeI/OmpD-associated family protein [Candidatus Saccharimonadales bacterium]|nr:YdeI/OmpD-associated family protein [Candidatus Saccharimonadales bacterium]